MYKPCYARAVGILTPLILIIVTNAEENYREGDITAYVAANTEWKMEDAGG